MIKFRGGLRIFRFIIRLSILLSLKLLSLIKLCCHISRDHTDLEAAGLVAVQIPERNSVAALKIS